MATKKKAETTYVVPADIQEKLDAYVAEFQTTDDKVIELALRDWFSDIDRGKWPRSSSVLEPSPILKT